jgi:hypothetical protein
VIALTTETAQRVIVPLIGTSLLEIGLLTETSLLEIAPSIATDPQLPVLLGAAK